MPPTQTRVNKQGLVEIIDLTTGKVLCVEQTPTDRYLKNKFDELTRIETPHGVVYIDRNINPQNVLMQSEPAYALGWAELLANDLVEGLSLPSACASHRLPYGLVKRWERLHPDFALLLEHARKDRAEQRAEKALQIAMATTHNSAKADKLKIDTLHHAAEKDDPERYGKREKLDITETKTTTFIIETGVPARTVGEAIEVPEGFEQAVKDASPRALIEAFTDKALDASFTDMPAAIAQEIVGDNGIKTGP